MNKFINNFIQHLFLIPKKEVLMKGLPYFPEINQNLSQELIGLIKIKIQVQYAVTKLRKNLSLLELLCRRY